MIYSQSSVGMQSNIYCPAINLHLHLQWKASYRQPCIHHLRHSTHHHMVRVDFEEVGFALNQTRFQSQFRCSRYFLQEAFNHSQTELEMSHLGATFYVLPTNCLNVSVVICFPQSFISCAVGCVGVFLKCFVNVL